ncbi:MAG: hypothetical protein AAGK32_13965 [Actinomycetota bacterium]
MTASLEALEAAVLDETVDLILDTRNALCEVLAVEVPHAVLEALVREMAAEVLDTYHAVIGDDREEVQR